MRKLLLVVLSITMFSCRTDERKEIEPSGYDNQWSSPYRASGLYPNHLVNKDSNYLFILNKTEWAYFACEYPEAVLRKVKKHGANVIRVLLEGTPYFDYLGYDLWPWGGTRKEPDFSTFNETYWDEVERRIDLAGREGIGIDLVLYFSLRPDTGDVTEQRPYWDYAIKRLSKYSNLLTWEIMNEYVKNESFQDIAGDYIRKNDPWHHPVCSSDGTTEDALWPQKEWMDLAVVHTCTGQEGYPLDEWYLSTARNTRQHGKPAINNETGREKRHRNDDPVHRRKQSWLFNNAGCFWTWHAWDGCEGINDTTYYYDGWQYLKPLRDFYLSVPFWRLQPNYTVLRPSGNELVYATMATPDRKMTIMYCCTEITGENVKEKKALIRVKDGTYRISYINPADLSIAGQVKYQSKGLRSSVEIELPDFTDDLIVMVVEWQSEERSLIEGTL